MSLKCSVWRPCQDGTAPLLAALALENVDAAALAATLLRYALLRAPLVLTMAAGAGPHAQVPASERVPQGAPASADEQALPGAPSATAERALQDAPAIAAARAREGNRGTAALRTAVTDGLAAAAAGGRDRHRAGTALLAELVMTLPPAERGARLPAVLQRLAGAPDQAPAQAGAPGQALARGPGGQAAVDALVCLLRWPLEQGMPDAVVAAAVALPRIRGAGPLLAAAFAHLPPEQAVPRLVRALGAGAGESECAVAGDLLLEALATPGKEIAALRALLQAVREAAGPSGKHTEADASGARMSPQVKAPRARITEQADASKGGASRQADADRGGVTERADDGRADRAVDLLRQWGARLRRERAAELAPGVAEAGLGALWAAPGDARVVQALAALSAGLFAAHPGPLLEGVRQRLAEQPCAPLADSVPDADQPSSECVSGVGAQPAAPAASGGAGQLYERLAPLIALRTLPVAALASPEAAAPLYGCGRGGQAPFEAAGTARPVSAPVPGAAAPAGSGATGGGVAPGSIAAALLRRMRSAAELPEVRRQAAELAGRLPGPAAERALVDMLVAGVTSPYVVFVAQVGVPGLGKAVTYPSCIGPAGTSQNGGA